MASEWDDRAKVEAEFPRSEWDWHPCRDGDGGTLVAMAAMQSGGFVFAEARWFGPGDGVVLIRKHKTQPADPKPADPKPRVSWWRRLFRRS